MIEQSENVFLGQEDSRNFRLHIASNEHGDLNQQGLWVWGDVMHPSKEWPNGAYSFKNAPTDDYGYIFDFKLKKDAHEMGVLINDQNGAHFTNDTMINLRIDTMREAWMDQEGRLYLYQPTLPLNVLRIYYMRQDNEYSNWQLKIATDDESFEQATAYSFNQSGAYGHYVNLPIGDKETPHDIKVQIVNMETNEISRVLSYYDLSTHRQLFINEQARTIFTNPYYIREQHLVSAEQVNEEMIRVEFNTLRGLDGQEVRELLEFYSDEPHYVDIKDISIEPQHRRIILHGDFSNLPANAYVRFDQKSVKLRLSWQLKDERYFYDGKLGVDWETTYPTLRVWSPSADEVNVIIYDRHNQHLVLKEIALNYTERGVWTVELSPDITGLNDIRDYYYHLIMVHEGQRKLALDPYAKSLAQWDGKDSNQYVAKAAFVNPSEIGQELQLDFANIQGFEKREDAIIYEVHVRDFTSDPEIASELSHPFGTFDAFIERLDYIQELGVTHIQLLPVMSYYIVNEFKQQIRELHYQSQNSNYNWGYDPQSYFALSGMYSSEPSNPNQRILSFKKLIAAIHERGMGVILDVVYNHTARVHLFEDLEPHYYHFMNIDGTPRESFGGGRLGSTHAMTRRFMIDSITYWVKEFKVDGFRYDMMGDHDAETIQMTFDEAKKINPNLIMLGEGWRSYAGDEHAPYVRAADQDWMEYTDSVGVFSDEIRNLLKSGYGTEGQPCFLTNGAKNIQMIYHNLIARPSNFRANDPGDVIQYIAAHDNLPLHDVIAQSIKKDPALHQEEIHQRIRIGNLMILTAQGTPFIHAGQEYGRTKQFKDPAYKEIVSDDRIPHKSAVFTDETGAPIDYPYFIDDSYNSTDIINRYEWAKAVDEEKHPISTTTQQFTKGLIHLRRSSDAFRMNRLEDIDQRAELMDIPEIQMDDLALAYCLTATDGTQFGIFVNASLYERVFTLKDSYHSFLSGDIIVSGDEAGTEPIESPRNMVIEENRLKIAPLSAVIIRIASSH